MAAAQAAENHVDERGLIWYWRWWIYTLKENLTLIIFFFIFVLIALEWDSITLFTKMNFFLLPKLTFQHHLHKVYIYMAFYLLTWTYFNDVNGGRNILINSQLKRILFMSSDKKMKQIWERKKKHENNSNESDFSENEIPGLNSQEAVVQKCSVKKVFLEILQKSQEKTCARVSFLITLQTSGLQLC